MFQVQNPSYSFERHGRILFCLIRFYSYIADLIDFNNDDMLVSSNAFQFPDSSALTPTPFRWNGTARRGRDGLFGDLLGSFFVSSPNFIECRLPNSPHTQMHNRYCYEITGFLV